MTAGIKKQIYFPPTDMDVYQYVISQPNHSQYLIRLARDDMAKPKGLTWTELLQKLEMEENQPSGG